MPRRSRPAANHATYGRRRAEDGERRRRASAPPGRRSRRRAKARCLPTGRACEAYRPGCGSPGGAISEPNLRRSAARHGGRVVDAPRPGSVADRNRSATSDGRHGNVPVSTTNGSAKANREQVCRPAGVDELVGDELAEIQPPVGPLEMVSATSAGMIVWGCCCRRAPRRRRAGTWRRAT